MEETNQESDDETFFKETFRTFSKDEEGCIPPEEMRFVFQYLGVIIKGWVENDCGYRIQEDEVG